MSSRLVKSSSRLGRFSPLDEGGVRRRLGHTVTVEEDEGACMKKLGVRILDSASLNDLFFLLILSSMTAVYLHVTC